MDANARRRGGSGGRTLAVAAAVIVLVAVVAVASGGSTPSGAVGAHRPSEGFLDAIVSLFVVGMAIATVLVVVMVSFFGRYQSDGSARKRKGPVQSVVTFIVAMALLTIVVRSLAGSVGPRLRPPATSRRTVALTCRRTNGPARPTATSSAVPMGRRRGRRSRR